MVAPPAIGAAGSSTAGPSSGPNLSRPIPHHPHHAANLPFSMRTAIPLDMRSVERKGQSTQPKEKTKRVRPHGLQEAPTFRPSVEEFADPIEYIKKIAPEARKYGICKIIPPDDWKPPFAIDLEKFHFRTRKQELNSIEGSTRTNLNYLDQLSKFHKQFGHNLVRFPSVDKRPLDLYKLKKLVEARGGFDKVCKGKKWAEIGRDLGYNGKIMSSLSTSLKGSYQRWLHPYEEWVRLAKPSVQQMMEMEKAGLYAPPGAKPIKEDHAAANGGEEDSPAPKASTPLATPKPEIHEPMEVDSPAPAPTPAPRPSSGFKPVNVGFKPVNGFTAVNTIISTRKEEPPNTPTPQRPVDGGHTSQATPELSVSNGHALKRTISQNTTGSLSELESLGDDDPTAHKNKRQKKDAPHTVVGSHMSLLKSNGPLTPAKSPVFQPNSKQGERCELCGQNENPSKLVVCDGCDTGAHKSCIEPPLKSATAGWNCHKCLVGTGEFGFQEGGVYSLRQFQEKAEKFKRDYFASRMTVDPALGTKKQVSEDDIEKEFWRLVESLTETVEVEYGADIHSTTHGSGFPDHEKDPTNPYSTDPWNLNVLPLLPDSLFRHIKSDVSGMTVPWLYVGMVFSTFCWHNEDHYTYSANYQHFGATKTWYGIPGEDADRFEQAMKQAVPELFEQQPDLLFQLVTLLPPDQLKKAGVNVYGLDQRAGQFVITFPQAYHAGFNHGFNFNEAVNFAPSDWEPFGQAGVARLQEFKKQACFSHDELLMNAAARDTTIKSAKWLAPALEKVLLRELAQRSALEKKRKEAISKTTPVDVKEGEAPVAKPEPAFEINDEDLSEDEYPCANCKAYTYLSRYRCKKSGKLMCLLHAGSHPCCDAEESSRLSSEDHVLVYRHSDNDLKEEVQRVYDRARQPEAWQEKVDKLMEEDALPNLKQIRTLVNEGERIPYDLPGLPDLKAFVDRCNEWVEEATAYITRKQQNRRKNERAWRRGTNNANKVEIDEKEHRKIENIERLLVQAEEIGFDCPEIATMRERRDAIAQYRRDAQGVLITPDMHTTEAIEALAETGKSFNVDIPEVGLLESYLTRRKWVDEAKHLTTVNPTLPTVMQLLERAPLVGISEDHPLRIYWLEQKDKGDIWERKAQDLMNAESMSYHQLDALCKQTAIVPVTPETLAKVDAILVRQKEAHKQVLSMNERCKDPDFRKRPKYKDVRAVMDSLLAFSMRPSGTVELEKDVKRNEDWMRRGKKLFGKSNAPLHILAIHMQAVKERNLNCFNLDERPSLPVEPSSREPSPVTEDGNSAGTGKSFCLCRQHESGQMIECDICHEWYHSRCLKLARGKVKDDEKYACPICDHRGKIPRDAARPKLEDLQDWKNDVLKLPFQPEEEELLDAIIDKALEFREFVAPYCNPEPDASYVTGGNLDIVSKRFYLRKIEGADILLAYETNYLRQELYKLVPIAPEPPPITNESNSTRKPRPTKQQKLMAQLGISNPDDLPQELRTKQHTFKHLEKTKKAAANPSAISPATTPLNRSLQSGSGMMKPSPAGGVPMANMTRPGNIAAPPADPGYANMFASPSTMSPAAWPPAAARPTSPIFRAPETPPATSVANLDPSLFSPSNGDFAAAALREVAAQATASPRFTHSRGNSNGGDMDNLFANFTNDAPEESNQAGEELMNMDIDGARGSPAANNSDIPIDPHLAG